MTPVEAHLASLRLPCTRDVNVSGATLDVLASTLCPAGDARCGWVTRRFRVGGSVPDGWATQRLLVLVDAVLSIDEQDGRPASFVSVHAGHPERLGALETTLVDAARAAIEAHLKTLNLTATRTVPLAGNGSAVHAALRERVLPRGDPRCGVLSHTFEYGGSVPEGTAERTTLVLVDAVIETDDFDHETNTFVKVRAASEARADALEALVRRTAALVGAT